MTEPQDVLAEALHDAMCDISHHDRPPARCSKWATYPNIAASVLPRLRAALVRTPETLDVERFRSMVERTIHAQTCVARKHKPGTYTQCRFPTAEAERFLREASEVLAATASPTPPEGLRATIYAVIRGEFRTEGPGGDRGWADNKANDLTDRVLAAALAASPAPDPGAGLREALESMVYQFAYWSEADPPGHWSGGLSALEEAFAALGWEEPHPAPFQQCDEPGCRKQSSMGTPTIDGYRRTCGDHYPRAGNEAWNAAWRESGLSYPDFVDTRRAAPSAEPPES